MTQTLTLGSVDVTRVLEYTGATRPPEAMFPGLDRATWRSHQDWLAPAFWNPATDLLQTCVQTWVLRTADETILIDTGVGNHKPRPGIPAFDRLDTDFLIRLRTAGVAPEDVTTVVLTHLHADHVGWNTRLVDGDWVPTFPNATYLLTRADFEYWHPAGSHRPRLAAANKGVFDDSIRPVERAGLLRLWEDDFELGHGLRLEAAPGHTPGSAILSLESGRDHAMFAGDLLHNPIQIVAPDLSSCFCEDPPTATATRRRLLARAAGQHALVFPAHLGGGLAVEVVEAGPGFAVRRWGFER
ncbi:MBL fold metallo-hydrolase [Amycolatopsis sp. cmx-8-4]|uniref:MBL fold metallo-hydrolase n=1 Tax=Amycolatopsis sp. cmx-8-4 TaxID=2790947 RepID=UPI00397C62CB